VSEFIDPKIESSWKEILLDEFQMEYMKNLKSFLTEELKNHTVYPPPAQMFAAFNACPFHEVKVVILGQDPYHGPGQAHGLCFSVNDGIKHPPSLRNIFKEIETDLGIPYPKSGNLTPWARRGVLLLNASLSVRAHQAGSHQKKGWEAFTDSIIQKISQEKEGVIFLLWGNFARKKASLIDRKKHHILESAHPSPLSAYQGFFGCNHFSRTNALLAGMGKEEINWRLEE